jgi:hypothetical protein
MITGIRRSVLVWYSANCGERSAWARNRRSRSSPVAPLASTLMVCVPASIKTSAWALRLWYQSGFVGAQALEGEDHVAVAGAL